MHKRHILLPEHLQWHWRSDVCTRLREELTVDGWDRSLELIKQTRRRSVYRQPSHPSLGCGGIFLKHEHPVNPRDIIKLAIRSKTRMEFDSSRRLFDAGIPTAEPIGWGRCGRHSILATCEIEGATDFTQSWNQALCDNNKRKAFLSCLAGFINILIRKGVSHPDMHTGNIVVNHGSHGWNFFLLDTYKCVIGKPLSRELLRRCLGWTLCFSYQLNGKELADFLRSALKDIGIPPRKAWRNVVRDQHNHIRHCGLARRKRLFNESSVCLKIVDQKGSWLVLSNELPDTISEAVAKHIENAMCGNWLKNDRKRSLSRVVADNRRFVVKEFRHPGKLNLGLCRSDAKSWFNTYRMSLHFIPAVKALGWLRSTDGRGFLIMEDGGEDSLYHGLAKCDVRRQRELLKAAGRMTAWLNLAGIYQRDLKCSNFLVSYSDSTAFKAMPLILTDLDAVDFVSGVKNRFLRRNIMQFLESLPEHITHRDKLFSLAACRMVAGVDRNRMRHWCSKAVDKGFLIPAASRRLSGYYA